VASESASHPPVLGPSARTLASVALGAVVSATLVFPGVRGISPEATVATWETIAVTLAYLLSLLASAFIFRGAYELIRPQPTHALNRFVVAGLGVVTFALSTPAFGRMPMPAALKVTTASLALVLTVFACATASRAMHTRAAGLVLAMLAFAALTRLVAYVTLQNGAEDASIERYALGMALSTGAHLLELVAYVLAALWLATRGGTLGKISVNLALITMIGLFWLGRGSPSGSSLRAIAQSAMADATAQSLPTRVPGLARFLAVASPALGAAFVVQIRHAPLVASGIALAVFSRGAFEIPACVFMAIAASIALTLAAGDPRSMWSQLIAAKN
jgi:hypothetical protein